MEPKTVYDLSDICESVFTGKPLTEAEDDENKKKDDEEDKSESPFADTSDDTEDTKEDTTDDDSDTDETTNSPFGGDTEDSTTDTDDKPASDDDEGDENGIGAPMDTEETPPTDGPATTEYDEIGQLGIEIIMLSAQVHFWHINCKKGSQHEALNSLYYKLNDGGDRLLEAVISKTNQSIVASGELSFDFGDLEFNNEEAIGILEDVRDHVNEVASSFAEDQTFANVLGDISEDLSSAIYKLSRFDSGASDTGDNG